MSKKNDKIDLIDSLAISGGEPQEITIKGADLRIRRDYTGAEVSDIIQMHMAENAKDRLDDQLDAVLAAIDADDDLEARTDFRDQLMALTNIELTPVMNKIGEIAGIRDEHGNFTPGAQS